MSAGAVQALQLESRYSRAACQPLLALHPLTLLPSPATVNSSGSPRWRNSRWRLRVQGAGHEVIKDKLFQKDKLEATHSEISLF